VTTITNYTGRVAIDITDIMLVICILNIYKYSYNIYYARIKDTI
jgi:hypothetical protein